jgi:hypothetical protein
LGTPIAWAARGQALELDHFGKDQQILRFDHTGDAITIGALSPAGNPRRLPPRH